ncbi:HugZ family protein [Thalassospira marina]|uniref:Pyridoxamine 5'-phosphate oxidase n=1 Tax=Thalassospira marina TaxID=2048283 RepID=A0A2N3KSQ8_9PROT|nr:pyridoxamine 5'-phosphate oxidase family protein [Thalassospira marina]PKR53550.1 pyridoxamine 5'-phosphate oxidase [Thalassospira marina]
MEQKPPAPANDAASLRRLMRQAAEATLATIAHDHGQVENGWPVASMVQPVIDIDGTPIILISELADHTRHIHHDPRISLMFRPGPMQQGAITSTAAPSTAPTVSQTPVPAPNALPVTDTQRLTIFGRASRVKDTRIQNRYLAIQPEAGLYAGFADFGFYRVDVEAAYWVGGFGKQRRLRGDQLCCSDCADLITGHDALIADLNKTRSALIAQIAHLHLPGAGDSETGWKVVAIDCDGANFTCNDTVWRIDFPHTIGRVEEAQNILVKIGQKGNETPA